MTKLIIFDLDGVLVDAKIIHFESLNMALREIDEKYVISMEEHLKIYDGLPTNRKLQILNERTGFPLEKRTLVWDLKQQFTIETIKKLLSYDEQKVKMIKRLCDEGYLVYVASNSIRKSVREMLNITGMLGEVDNYFGNEDCVFNKPHPEIYTKCILHAQVKPSETIIVEDSKHGREAAIESGAHLLPVESPKDVTYENIIHKINSIASKEKKIIWESNNFNVLIPMAGAGSRFAAAGYTFPKPLIEVNNQPMIKVVIDNLAIKANYIYIVQKEHYEKYNLNYLLNLITPNCSIIQVDGLTEGAACTTLLAKELINNDKRLLIANSDQFIDWNANDFYYSFESENIDGSILTFNSTHPKWSFIKLDEDGYVTELAEKKPISDIATVGIYAWTKGSEYVKYAEQMIDKNIRVNNEFYVAPVYNEAIADGKKIKNYNIEKMWGIGTPEDLNYFLTNKQF